MKIECYMCGTCCTAFDISSLNKKAGIKCKHLLSSGKCGDYENRPEVCRSFKADEICTLISTLNFEEKILTIKKIYDI